MSDLDRELDALCRNPHSFPPTPEEVVEDLAFLELPPLSDPATNREIIVRYLAEKIDHIMMPRVAGDSTKAHRFTFRLSPQLNEFLRNCGLSILNALVQETGLLIAFTGDGTLVCAFYPQRKDSR